MRIFLAAILLCGVAQAEEIPELDVTDRFAVVKFVHDHAPARFKNETHIGDWIYANLPAPNIDNPFRQQRVKLDNFLEIIRSTDTPPRQVWLTGISINMPKTEVSKDLIYDCFSSGYVSQETSRVTRRSNIIWLNFDPKLVRGSCARDNEVLLGTYRAVEELWDKLDENRRSLQLALLMNAGVTTQVKDDYMLQGTVRGWRFMADGEVLHEELLE